jgi:hypothetical protein
MARKHATLDYAVQLVQETIGQPDRVELLDLEVVSQEPAGGPHEPVIEAALAECLATPASSTKSASADELGDPSSPVPPDFGRHARACRICSHPDRDAIEGDFIRWQSPGAIAENHKIADRSSIYRHAHATGLFARRRREFARVLENILQRVEYTRTDWAGVIVSAARVYAHLDDRGRWVEPPKTHIILTGWVAPPAQGDLRPIGPNERRTRSAKKRRR